MNTHKVPAGYNNIRLRNYLQNKYSQDYSNKYIKKAIKNNQFLIDGKIANTGDYISEGQVISFIDDGPTNKRIFEFPLDVIYADEYLAVVYKPAGVVVSGNLHKTIENALPFNIKIKDDYFPRPVHRLDKYTKGLLLIARTRKCRILLGKEFEENRIYKRYRAVVCGKTEEEGLVETNIDKKSALTKYKRIKLSKSKEYNYLSLLDIKIESGRKNQIRRHMKDAGTPVLGDKQFGDKTNLLKYKGLFLCSVELKFKHPITQKEVCVNIEQPKRLETYMNYSDKKWKLNSEAG